MGQRYSRIIWITTQGAEYYSISVHNVTLHTRNIPGITWNKMSLVNWACHEMSFLSERRPGIRRCKHNADGPIIAGEAQGASRAGGALTHQTSYSRWQPLLPNKSLLVYSHIINYINSLFFLMPNTFLVESVLLSVLHQSTERHVSKINWITWTLHFI